MQATRKKQRELSPERTVVWMERSSSYLKASVVYYLCRNRHLEHPHFIEVSLSSPEGLYLRDVINRLNVLRGRGMAARYSWSSKRSYKNGYVWHDLSEDDRILPVHGNDYVLKGSELHEEPNPGRFSPIITNMITRPIKPLPGTASCRSQGDSSSSSSMNSVERAQQDDGGSPLPDSRNGNNSSFSASLSLLRYEVEKKDLVDASTQTEDKMSPRASIDGNDSVSLSSSSDFPSAETLESLMKADTGKMKGLPPKLKHGSVLMQLISCGSISVKEHNFGSVYNTHLPGPKFSSPTLSSSIMVGHLPHLSGLKFEDKEYFSGSIVETKSSKTEESTAPLTRSSSCNADRNDRIEWKAPEHSRCLPRAMKVSVGKQGRSESMTSSLPHCPRKSFGRTGNKNGESMESSIAPNGRMTACSSSVLCATLQAN